MAPRRGVRIFCKTKNLKRRHGSVRGKNRGPGNGKFYRIGNFPWQTLNDRPVFLFVFCSYSWFKTKKNFLEKNHAAGEHPSLL